MLPTAFLLIVAQAAPAAAPSKTPLRPLEELLKAVVYLSTPVRPPTPSEAKPPSQIGTGFLIQLREDLYLVTAEHVADQVTAASEVVIFGAGDRPERHPLIDWLPRSIDWVRHGVADVAVLRVDPPAVISGAVSARALQ